MLIEFENSNHCRSHFQIPKNMMTLFSNKIEEYLQRWPAMNCILSLPKLEAVGASDYSTPTCVTAWMIGQKQLRARDGHEIRDRSRNIAWTIIVHHKEKTLKMTIANLRHFTEKLIGQKPWVGISSRRFCTAMSTDLSI